MNKKHIQLIFILLLNLTMFGQKKEEFKDVYGHFVIKLHSVSTQKISDALKAEDSIIEKKWNGNVPPLTPAPPHLPESVAFDIQNSAIHLIIMPEHYTQYTIQNDFESDTTATYGVLDVIKINRENLNVTKFVPLRFEIYKSHPKTYSDFSSYNLIKENREIKRKIAGYDCFQIILNNVKNKMMVEMYVTEEINLNYHPIFNYREILSNYYPLYVKIYDEDFPNDSYDEYKFYKY